MNQFPPPGTAREAQSRGGSCNYQLIMRRELLKDKTKHLPNKNNHCHCAIPVSLKEPSPFFLSLSPLLILDFTHCSGLFLSIVCVAGSKIRLRQGAALLGIRVSKGSDLSNKRHTICVTTSAVRTVSVLRDMREDNKEN